MQDQTNHAQIKTKLIDGATYSPIPNARVRFFASIRNADSRNGAHNCEPKVIGEWHQVAIGATDEFGYSSKYPSELEPGQYRVRFVLPEKHQIQNGTIRMNYVDAEIFLEDSKPIELHMLVFHDGYQFIVQ